MDADSLALAAAALPLPLAPLDLNALTLQQRRYLAALQAGADYLNARKRASGPSDHSGGVSPSTVAAWLKSAPFARAHDAVHAGLAVLGVPASREVAAAAMPDLVGHWVDKAYHAERDRDQATFGQLVGQTAQAIGQGAQASASATARVVIVSATVTGGPPVGRVLEATATSTEALAPPAPGTPPPPLGAGTEPAQQ